MYTVYGFVRFDDNNKKIERENKRRLLLIAS